MAAAAVPPSVPSELKTDSGAGKLWWLALAAGVLTTIIGLVALFFPEPTLLAVGIIFGAYLIFWGVMEILRGITDESDMSTVLKVVYVILGTLTVFAGLILLVRPGQSVVLAALVLGFWWVVSGVMQFVVGIAQSEGRAWNLMLGALGMVAGAIILFQPAIGLVTLVWIVAIGLIVQGVIEIALGLQIRKLHKEGEL
jgi:uncharacterized membrane protein HdeD (DUF308 family)